MIDITTKYMGIQLNSPLIASSSDFTSNLDSIVKLADAGCGAIVLKSIFEEQILMEIDSQRVNNMFDSYTDTENYISYYTRKHELDNYIRLIKDAKSQTKIPIIASIHCSTAEGWTEFTKTIELAGADGIEINVFILPSDVNKTAVDIEKTYFSIVENVKKHTNLPIAVKLHYYFTDMARFMKNISTQVDALVLFNRFFNPDIDIENEKVISAGSFSQPEDNYLIQRWVGILRPHIKSNIAANGGIHNGNALIKNILAGADVIQIASVLYKNGIDIISVMNNELISWMERKNYNKLSDFKGKLSYQKISNPSIYERAQFMKYYGDSVK